MEVNEVSRLEGELCTMKDALMQLESSIRNDAEGPAVLTSPPPQCPLLSPPTEGSGSEPSSPLPPPPEVVGATCNTPQFPPPPPLLLPGVRPPTPPVLRWSERSAFRTFNGENTGVPHRNPHLFNGTSPVSSSVPRVPRLSASGATSNQHHHRQDVLSPPPPLLPPSSGHSFGSQFLSSAASGTNHGLVDQYLEGKERSRSAPQQHHDKHPFAFLLQFTKERSNCVDDLEDRGQTRQDAFNRSQQANFPELQLDHHEMSKKYKENLKHSQKQNREDMVRKFDYRGPHSQSTRHGSARFHGRVNNIPFEGMDNQLENCVMSTSATQTGDQSLNGNLDSPDMDSSLLPPPPPPLVTNSNLSSIYQEDWPIDRILWNSAPTAFGEKEPLPGLLAEETASMMSWSSNVSNTGTAPHPRQVLGTNQPLGTKVEMVYSLLSMLGAHDKEDMSKTLLAMSQTPESCIAMRQSGCLPLLIQLLHGTEESNGTIPEDGGQAQRAKAREARRRASQALHKIIHAQVDDKRSRRETRVLRLLEQIREYCDTMRDGPGLEPSQGPEGVEMHAGPAMAALMKLSFDEEHRNAMCQLGGLHAIAELIEVDQMVHGSTSDQFCVTLRRYAGMALTNLTFGDGNNKALLCSMKSFMYGLVAQLHSPSEDLRQVMASVLRNLSWRADSRSKQLLREVGAVSALMGAAMEASKESTLKSVLSALWNLSAHCSANKADICSFQGSLGFLVNTLNHHSPAIIENGGGILRNISSHIAVHEEYRTILRRHNCLQILLEHLKSSSLTVVSNACGTLWNLSARCTEDQKALWDMGAVGMLRNLVHSKHKMISMGSSAALKNLLSANPAGHHGNMALSQRVFGGNSNMPSLVARKQKALEEELDQNLSETCDNIDSPKTSPTHRLSLDNRFNAYSNGNFPPQYSYLPGRMYYSVNGQISNDHVPRSESRESVGSTHSEPIHPHHRTFYHSFSRNSRYMSTDHRHYGNHGFEQAGFVPGNRNLQRRPLSEVSYPDRLDNSICNKHYVLSSEMKRQSEYLRKEAEKHAALQGCQTDEERPKTPIVPDSPAPAHNTGNMRPIKDAKKFVKKADEGSSTSEVQEQPIDYSCKLIDDPAAEEKRKKQLRESIFNVKEVCTAKNEQNTQERAFSAEQSLNNPWQHLNSPSFHPYTLKQTQMALRKSGQECSLQHITYGSYMETDLDGPDQPTDFSQKYKEHMGIANEFEAPRTMSDDGKDTAFHDDALKVYCTEGTPLNYSPVSSVVDLRDDRQSTSQPSKAHKPKPVIAFANPAENQDARIDENKNATDERWACKDSKEDMMKKCDAAYKEAAIVSVKSVTFGEEVNCSTDTPLMFSRTSSLGSLGSFDHHSIHDDRSSVVSDFSRRTSEVVSPSDLPDSPSQSMLPSPRHVKDSQSAFVYPTRSEQTGEDAPLNLKSNTPKERLDLGDQSVDSLRVFAVENTPVNMSTTGSLSTVTIDEEPRIQCKDFRKSAVSKDLVVENFDDPDDYSYATSSISLNISSGNTASNYETLQGSSSADIVDEGSDTDDEELLVSRLKSGIPGNNRHSNIIQTDFHNLRSPSKLRAAKSGLPQISSQIVKRKAMAGTSFKQANEFDDKAANESQLSNSAHSENITVQQQGTPSTRSKIPTPFSSSASKQPSDSSMPDSEIVSPARVSVLPKRIQKTEDTKLIVPKNTGHTCGLSQGWPKSPDHNDISTRGSFEVPKNRLVTAVRPLPHAPEAAHSYDVTPISTSTNSSCTSSMYDGDLQVSAKGCPTHDDDKPVSDSFPRTTQEVHNQPDETLLAFSLNSSIESTDELSAGEQALLEDCINAGKPKSNRSKVKKCGIPIFCGAWTRSQDSESLQSSMMESQEAERLEQPDCQSSNDEREEKGKEDERARENLKKGESVSSWSGSEDFSKENSGAGTPQGNIAPIEESPSGDKEDVDEKDEVEDKDEENDEMLLVVTLSGGEERDHPQVVLKPHEPMTESLEILEEAQKLAHKVEADAEDMTQSSLSCISDIENAKAPSMMGDLLSLSMTSSNSISEIEKGATWRKTKDGRRVAVPTTVRRALAGNRDVMKTSCNSEMIGSLENLSLKGSLTFELLENINPPSAMDQITRTGSCASLNSISSEILEGKSQSLDDKSQNFKTSCGSVETYDRLNAAAAMVQVYSRELSSIMNGVSGAGQKSSSTSENVLDRVHPPTVFKDIAQMTVQDELDIVTDSIASDTEMVEELPRDDETEGISSDTLMAPYLMSFAKDEQIDGSTENVSTLVEDEPNPSPKRKFTLSKLEISAEEFQTLQDDANLLVSTLHKMGKQDSRTLSSGSIDKLLDDETLSLISNESDGENSEHSSPKPNKGPRIIKPINRDAIRQIKDKTVKDVQTSPTTSRIAIPKSKDSAKVVRPLVPSGRSALNSKKPPPFSCPPTSPKHIEISPKSPSPQTASKTPSPKFNSNTYTKSKGKSSTTNPPSVPDNLAPTTDENRPKLIKQGTFTKDSPTHSPAKSSKGGSPVTENKPLAMSSTSMPDRRMSYGGSSSSNVQNFTNQMKRNLSGANLKKDIGNGMRNSASSRSLTRQDEGVNRGHSASGAKRSPSSSSLGSPCESGLTGSNVSLSSNSSMGTGATRKNSSNKKEVSSRIASIWKKQETTKQSRISPERADQRGKVAGVTTGKSKIAKPVTPATARNKLGALGRKGSSS